MEEGEWQKNEVGSPQGSAISVLLSNVYLHYVLDLWFEKVVKPRLKGEAYLIRYIDDFVVCFQYQTDAVRFQQVLEKRLAKFALELEPNKTRLVEFGRYAQRNATLKKQKVETIYFLGFTHYCTRNRKGNFRLGRKTEKTRLRRSVKALRERMKKIRHNPVKDQAKEINQVLRGHYGYYGLGGNSETLRVYYRMTKKYWYQMLKSRSRKSNMTWSKFDKLHDCYPLQQPKLQLSYRDMSAIAVL